jgi:hypothetical protein
LDFFYFTEIFVCYVLILFVCCEWMFFGNQNLRCRYERLDILCCNAGVMMLPYSVNEAGIETQFATNHLGHYLLVGTSFIFISFHFFFFHYLFLIFSSPSLLGVVTLILICRQIARLSHEVPYWACHLPFQLHAFVRYW